MNADSLSIRAVRDADSDAVIDLIGSIYGEYGDKVHLEKVDRDLVNLEAAYAAGGFWVLTDDEAVVGTVAIMPRGDTAETCELKRLYLHGDLRGSGWGEHLLDWACDAARSCGYTRMDFWSDVRFTRAHAFYEKRGFLADGSTRTLDDAWEPYSEYFYSRAL